MEKRMLIQPIHHSELDIIGDIHGEIHSLNTLLSVLGYDTDGNHPNGRHLIFVGDLVDRGINSWAVFKKVRDLVNNGKAQCILGNHELNLLIPDSTYNDGRPKMKGGNNWFHGAIELVDKSNPNSIQPQYLLKNNLHRIEIQEFLSTLPVALEGDGIRIVHACWQESSINQLRELSCSSLSAYNQFKQCIHETIYEDVQQFRQSSQMTRDVSSTKDFLMQLGKDHPLTINASLATQNDNPVKVITSGLERKLDGNETPYEAGKKMRFVKRDRWWDRYTDSEMVIFGHYWRKAPHPIRTLNLTPNDKRDIPPTFLPHEGPFDLLGPKKNVMCVDYSVGKRFLERYHKVDKGTSGAYLGALRYTKTGSQTKVSIVLEDQREFHLQ